MGNELLFTNEAGLYIEPMEEKIESSFGDTIYYTLDGSLPLPNSAVYEGQSLLKMSMNLMEKNKLR